MGWTSYHAKFYKNGNVDKKAECDYYFNKHKDIYEVLKSAMVGNTYYGAIKQKSSGNVFGVVFKTSVDNRNYFNFSYKDMEETMLPSECDCPIGILKLLSPTDNEWANEWRKNCNENARIKKETRDLDKAEVGTRIVVTMPCDTRLFAKGEQVIIIKKKNYNNRTQWVCENMSVRFTNALMNYIKQERAYKIA